MKISSLESVMQELCSGVVIGHKDKGVKSLVACCLADLLRLYAPHAPFNPKQLEVNDLCH